jgi:tRNA1Val (adenine37-N6)-methyltransferase
MAEITTPPQSSLRKGLTIDSGVATTKGLHKTTTDTLALAGFVLPLDNDKNVIELGLGTGALALMIAASCESVSVVGVELHHGAVVAAAENIQRSGLASKVEVVERDWRELYDEYKEGAFDLVVSNPPYIKKGTGRVSPAPHRALARHESAGTLSELIDVAAYLAGSKGRVAFVFPIGRFCELVEEVRERKLKLRRLSFVYTTKKATSPLLFLIEFGRDGVFLLEPPVFIQQG